MSKDKFKWQRQKKVFSAIDGFYNSKKRKNRKIARPQSAKGRQGKGLLFYSFFALSVLMAGPRGRSGPCHFVKPLTRVKDLPFKHPHQNTHLVRITNEPAETITKRQKLAISNEPAEYLFNALDKLGGLLPEQGQTAITKQTNEGSQQEPSLKRGVAGTISNLPEGVDKRRSFQAHELWIAVAREKLSVSKADAARIMHGTIVSCRTWDSYCQEIGCNRRTVNRWLARQFAKKCDNIAQFEDKSWYHITHNLLPSSKRNDKAHLGEIVEAIPPNIESSGRGTIEKHKSLTHGVDKKGKLYLSESRLAELWEPIWPTLQRRPGKIINTFDNKPKALKDYGLTANESHFLRKIREYEKANLSWIETAKWEPALISYRTGGRSSIVMRSSPDYMRIWRKSRQGRHNIPLGSRSSPQTATGRLKTEDKGLYRPAWKNFLEKY